MDIKRQILNSFVEIKKKDKCKIYFKGAFYKFKEYYYPIKLYFLVDNLEQPHEAKFLNYDNLVLVEGWMEPNDFTSFLNTLEDETVISLKTYTIKLNKGYFVNSNENPSEAMNKRGYYEALSDYERAMLKEKRSFPNTILRKRPSQIFMLKYQPDSEMNNIYREEYFKQLPIKAELSIFPDYFSALDWWLGKEITNISDWTILFSFPVSKAMIKSVNYSKDKFIVNIISDKRNIQNLLCKYYVGYEKLPSETGKIKITNSNKIQVSENVRRLYIVLYDKRKPDEIIDYRDFNWQYPFGALKELEIEYDEENIDYILSIGENRRTEFKLEISKTKEKEFLETFCSFANTEGGVVIIGVDDAGHVKGLNEGQIKAYRQRIADSVRVWIEPQISYELNIVEYSWKKILVAEIAKGNNPPYNYKDHGIYVRADDRDRIATVDEIHTLFSENNKLY